MQPISDWKDASDVINKLSNRYGTDGNPKQLIENFADVNLRELQLVANAVKHGKGRSYAALEAMSATVVDPARLGRDWTVGPFSTLTIPLSIEPADVTRYKDAILRFWGTEGTFWTNRSNFG